MTFNNFDLVIDSTELTRNNVLPASFRIRECAVGRGCPTMHALT